MANAITCVRIVCAAALLVCPTFSGWFYLIYVLGGVSDVLDGFAARRLGKETEFGARLDTVADMIFTVVVLIKVVRAVVFPKWIIVWIICIAIIKCINVLSGYVLHRRFVSEHTVMNKLCGVLLFAVPIGIDNLPWQAAAVLTILTCAAATFAAVQEGHLIRSWKEKE